MQKKQTGSGLAEIARRCGVNKGTASRVLNNKLHKGFTVRPETRDEILRVAKELDYRPSVVARSLTGRRARIVLVQGIQSTWLGGGGIYDEILSKATQTLNASGFIACASFPHPEYGEFGLLPWSIEGALVIQPPTLDSVAELEASSVPYVAVNGTCGPSGSCVLNDDEWGAREATRHLLELGHTAIACWLPREAHHSSVLERERGYRNAMESSGSNTRIVKFSELGEADALVRSCALRGTTTAIIAYDHNAAFALLSAARDQGIVVPRDLSIIGFNDVPTCLHTSPPLSVMAVPSSEMGRQAADILISAMESGGTPKHVRIRGRMVLRASTERRRQS